MRGVAGTDPLPGRKDVLDLEAPWLYDPRYILLAGELFPEDGGCIMTCLFLGFWCRRCRSSILSPELLGGEESGGHCCLSTSSNVDDLTLIDRYD